MVAGPRDASLATKIGQKDLYFWIFDFLEFNGAKFAMAIRCQKFRVLGSFFENFHTKLESRYSFKNLPFSRISA